jgi:hypothetical protein
VTVWFVHRRGDGGIAWAGQYAQPGYADEQLDDATSAELQTYLIPAVPPLPKPTPREWLERLSPTTQLALEAAALSNAQVSLWLRKATGAGAIDVTLPETQQGVAAVVAAGLLTQSEETTLLTP